MQISQNYLKCTLSFRGHVFSFRPSDLFLSSLIDCAHDFLRLRMNHSCSLPNSLCIYTYMYLVRSVHSATGWDFWILDILVRLAVFLLKYLQHGCSWSDNVWSVCWDCFDCSRRVVVSLSWDVKSLVAAVAGSSTISDRAVGGLSSTAVSSSFTCLVWAAQKKKWGLSICITSWYPEFNGRHFWLATQLYPQNDWTGWHNRMSNDEFAQDPLFEHDSRKILIETRKFRTRILLQCTALEIASTKTFFFQQSAFWSWPFFIRKAFPDLLWVASCYWNPVSKLLLHLPGCMWKQG